MQFERIQKNKKQTRKFSDDMIFFLTHFNFNPYFTRHDFNLYENMII